MLRTRPDGFKFRRQHPIGDYSLDFACLSARLAIEIDGEIHSRGKQPAHDALRDKALLDLGFHTVRIPARDVLNDLDSVITGIVTICREREPLHHAASRRGPPPRSGEVFPDPTPPRNGEGDRSPQASGGGVSPSPRTQPPQ